MMDLNAYFDAVAQNASVLAERAIAEFRAGRPVILTADGESLLAFAAETFDDDAAQALVSLPGGIRLLVSGPRLRRLGAPLDADGALNWSPLDRATLEQVLLAREARLDAEPSPIRPVEEVVLTLTHLAQLRPIAIVAPAPQVLLTRGLLTVPARAIEDYKAQMQIDLRIVSRAPVPLEGASQAEMVVFRGGEGLRDQAAVIIGQPDFTQPTVVRLHSACLTGDLFASLKCDCGDQLRFAARKMAQQGGGVILYLDQEGRGSGLANKMRAYALQATGCDTFEADEILGFRHDQRHFDFAAVMLRQLGVSSIRLLTNNPAKIQALRDAGLDVLDERSHGRLNEHNQNYLAAKRDQAGHLLDP